MPGEPSITRRPFLAGDGLRGLAATLVLLTHVVFAEPNYALVGWSGLPGRDPAAVFGGGHGQQLVLALSQVGLGIFFALSAYLLGRPYLAWALGERRPVLWRYAVRRVLRIVPAFWVVCAAIVLWIVVLRGGPLDLSRSLRAVLFLHDFRFDWAVALDQAWSIRAEALGYVLLPLAAVVWWLAARFAGRAGALVAILATGGAAIAWTLTQGASVSGPSTQLWLFGPGLLVALVESWDGVRDRLVARARRVAVPLALLGGLAMLVALPVGFDVARGLTDGGASPMSIARGQLATQMTLQLPGALVLVVGLLVVEWDGDRPALGLGGRVPRWLGARSYGIYLTHYAIIGLLLPHVLPGERGLVGYAALAVVVYAATLAASDVLFRVVERPAIRLAARITASPPPGPLAMRVGRAATGTSRGVEAPGEAALR